MNTNTKAFCSDGLSFGAAPNHHVSVISAAHPGTLPVGNKEHVQKAIKLGLALGCSINRTHFFDRKHYFYPDLPKGYQITQDNQPICIGGTVNIKVGGTEKEIRIHHIHMEEDAGKNIHDLNDEYSLLDLNRAGTPLLELVTEPDLSSGEEVFAFIAELQKLLRYIDVSDADMEKGSLRCDCNVSIKPKGVTELGERCEIKNLNSKRFAREAVKYEALRQIKMKEAGTHFSKQTLHYDPVANRTQVMREKEGVADYRYFPDPDLPPMHVTDQELETIKNSLPEMPWAIKARLKGALKFSEDYAEQLTQSPEVYAYFEQLSEKVNDPKLSANLVINQILPNLNGGTLSDFPISIDECATYLKFIASGKVSASAAHQQLWPELLERNNQDIEQLANELNLVIDQDSNALGQLIAEVVAQNPKQLQEYKKGKKALIGFFIGAIMRSSKGGVDPKQLKKELVSYLDSQ